MENSEEKLILRVEGKEQFLADISEMTQAVYEFQKVLMTTEESMKRISISNAGANQN